MTVDRQYIVVWEGEWPVAKYYAKYGRIAAWTISDFVNTLLDVRKYGAALSKFVAESDKYIVNTSFEVSQWAYGNPWIAPACGVGSFASFVFVKSTRWGLFAATRNGVLAGSAALCFMFPHEIRRMATDMMPF